MIKTHILYTRADNSTMQWPKFHIHFYVMFHYMQYHRFSTKIVMEHWATADFAGSGNTTKDMHADGQTTPEQFSFAFHRE